MNATFKLCSRALGQPKLRELFLDRVVHVVFAELVCHANRVLYCVRIGTPMADDRDSLDAEQRCSSEFRIVQATLERAERILREDGADLCRKRAMQFLSKHFDEGFE